MPPAVNESPFHVQVPLFERDADGAILPNLLFHRPWDKLHSRCIEYPFAASQLGDAKHVLDIGTAKADKPWLAWLEQLPIQVSATDYDPLPRPLAHVSFYQADVRALPIPDEHFDRILAVSVIEHIGLSDPQVTNAQLPAVDADGDVAAVRELARLLRPGGELVMTMPFGKHDGLILGNQARSYTKSSLRRFEAIIKPVKLEYYEYQNGNAPILYEEFPRLPFLHQMRSRLVGWASRHPVNPFGLVTWRRLPLERTSARNHGHIDGVICGVWRKP